MKKSHVFFQVAAVLGLTACTPCQYPPECCVVEERYIHKYGIDVPKEHWEQTGQNGQVVSTTQDGITVSKNYYNGMLEGETTYTFPNSSDTQRIEVYAKDQMVRETFFYTNGRPQKEIAYDSTDQTTVKEWYPNGSMKSSEKFEGNILAKADYYDPNQEHASTVNEGTGTRMRHDLDGNPETAEIFASGDVETKIVYYPNGTPKEIIPYKNGIVDGLKKTYYPGGEPMTIETWSGNRQQGVTTLFRDGQREEEVPYINGKKNGVGRVYKDGSTVVQERTWKDDLLHGPAKTFIAPDRIATDWYYKGKKVSKGYFDSMTNDSLRAAATPWSSQASQ